MNMEASQSETYREGQFAASDEISLYYREYGVRADTTPVVCLHGYWRTSKDFEELAAYLAPQRRVIAPDLRGRGRSGRSKDTHAYDLEKLEEDVLGLMDSLKAERAVIVGLALGAQLAMDIAAKHPERVAGIVFNDSAPETVASSGNKMKAFSGDDELTYEVALSRVKAQYEAAFPRMDAAGFERLLYRNYRQTEAGGYVRDFDQLTNEALWRTAKARPTFWDAYEVIPDVPIAILRGANSDFITPEIVARMLSRRSRAKLYTIPGVGHPTMLWEPEVFAAIDELLAEVDGGS